MVNILFKVLKGKKNHIFFFIKPDKNSNTINWA